MKYTKLTILIATVLFSLGISSSAEASTCNDIADGNWNSSSTWSCGIVPDGDDDVTIDSHTVTMTANQSVRGMTIEGGNFNMGSYNLSSYGDWTYTAGTLISGTSTLTFAHYSISQTFTPGNVEYYNLKIDKEHYDLNISGTVTVLNELNISSNGSNGDILGGTIEIEGNVVMQSSVFNGGTAIIKLIGDNNQSISSNGGYFPGFIIEKSGGLVRFLNSISIRNNWNWISGDLEAGANSLIFTNDEGRASNSYFTPGDVIYYNVYCMKNNFGLTFQGNLKLENEFKVYSTGSLSIGGYTITTKNFVQTGGTISMGSGAMKVTGNFTRSGGTFTAGTSVVAFQGKNQIINVTGAPTTFYKLYKLVNSADTLTITAGNTITIASGGVMRFWGKYEDVYGNSATLSVRSSSPGTPYTITRTGSAKLEYTDWQDASWSASQTASASTLGTGNTNLTVTKEFISTIRATGGDYSTLSAWEAAVNCDLTSSATKVFSHSGITGAMPDNSSVTGATSGATGTAVHTTANQILIKSISGTFQSGEQVQIDGSNYVSISDTGYGAIATAHPYNDWPSGLDNAVTIDGWTTNSTHYLKIYVLRNQRHDGSIDGDGFYIKYSGAGTYIWNISIRDSYCVIDGIKIIRTSVNWSWGTAVYADFNYPDNSSYAKINNNLLYQESGGGEGDLIHFVSDSSDAKASNTYNNIVISNSSVLKGGIKINSNYDSASWQKSFAMNNTVFGKFSNYGGFYLSSLFSNESYAPEIKNNYSANTGSGTDYRFNDNYSNTWYNFDFNYSDDNTSGSSNHNGQMSISDASFLNTNLSTGNLHIGINSKLKGYGTDLSIDPDFPVIDDIDGATRPVWDSWDIGADQTPKKIYRSVGPGNTTAIATGASNDLNIASDWAIFSAALPDNVGVGDAIQYDSDDDGTIDSVAFISERISSTYYRIQDYKGETPNQTSASDNDWSLFRAYTSLTRAESGTENTGINATVRNFDTWSGGRDLTTDDVQWNIACYGDAEDTTAVQIGDWTTSPQNYLKVYTPYLESEVGESQRHNGVWDEGKYRLVSSTTVNGILNIQDNYVYIDGLQVKQTGEGNYISVINFLSGNDGCHLHNCILDHAGGSSCIVYKAVYSSNTNDFFASNNIIYSSGEGVFDKGFYIYNVLNSFIYNNTVSGFDKSYYQRNGGAMLAKNNISQNSGSYGYYVYAGGTFNSDSTNNLSDRADAPGSNPINNATVLFRSVADYDFHLHPNDSVAKNAGVNLKADSFFPFSTDIDGQERMGTWDIGADETLGEKAKFEGKTIFEGDIHFE